MSTTPAARASSRGLLGLMLRLQAMDQPSHELISLDVLTNALICVMERGIRSQAILPAPDGSAAPAVMALLASEFVPFQNDLPVANHHVCALLI